MQIISNFYNAKAYTDWFTILKAIDAESPIVIVWDISYIFVKGSLFDSLSMQILLFSVKLFWNTFSVSEILSFWCSLSLLRILMDEVLNVNANNQTILSSKILADSFV